MPQLDRRIIKERAQRLRTHGALALRRHLEAETGVTRRVLLEFELIGRTEQFTPVKLSRSAVPGTIVDVKIGGHDGERLLAA